MFELIRPDNPFEVGSFRFIWCGKGRRPRRFFHVKYSTVEIWDIGALRIVHIR